MAVARIDGVAVAVVFGSPQRSRGRREKHSRCENLSRTLGATTDLARAKS